MPPNGALCPAPHVHPIPWEQHSPFFGRCHGIDVPASDVGIPGDGADGEGGGTNREGVGLPGRTLGCRGGGGGGALYHQWVSRHTNADEGGSWHDRLVRDGCEGACGSCGLQRDGRAASYRSCLAGGIAGGRANRARRAEGRSSQHDELELARRLRRGERSVGGGARGVVRSSGKTSLPRTKFVLKPR